MSNFSLKVLVGKLLKTVTVTSTEIEQEDNDCKGMFVFRDKKGEKFLWSPGPKSYEFHPVKTVAEADQVTFLCPLCFEKNGGSKGTHSVMVSFAGRNIPDEAGMRDHTGKPSRWEVSGTSIDDLVLKPSIALDAGNKSKDGCHWHGFVGSNGIPPGHAG